MCADAVASCHNNASRAWGVSCDSKDFCEFNTEFRYGISPNSSSWESKMTKCYVEKYNIDPTADIVFRSAVDWRDTLDLPVVN